MNQEHVIGYLHNQAAWFASTPSLIPALFPPGALKQNNMKERLWSYIRAIRLQSPLVYNITNYVVMNNTANALLAAGASPLMSHAQQEIEDIAGISQALVVNIGTLDEYWKESMLMASAAFRKQGKPWVLDPVGAGASGFRNRTLEALLQNLPAVIRGNASEIMALAGTIKGTSKGVDSTESSYQALDAAQLLSRQYRCTVCISGATDYIVQDGQIVQIQNGHPMMTKVTGLGCTASALIAAGIAVSANFLEATVATVALLGICGEIAAERAAGPGSLQVQLLDTLYQLSQDDFNRSLKITV